MHSLKLLRIDNGHRRVLFANEDRLYFREFDRVVLNISDESRQERIGL